jgi:hypothetical protein
MVKQRRMIAPIVFGIIDKPSSSQVSKNNSYIALSVFYRPAADRNGTRGKSRMHQGARTDLSKPLAGELGDFIAPGLVARPWCGARNRSPVLDPVPIRFRAPVEKRCKTAAREQFRDAGVVVPPLGVQSCRSPGQREITQCQKSKRGTVTYSS